MGLIENFIARYTKEYDFYDQAGRMAAQLLDNELQAAGVRAIVSSRAKAISRVHDKCAKRERAKGPYASMDDIFNDIVDLAGVRVALYFPSDRDEVDGVISRLFHLAEPKREFPEPIVGRSKNVFLGYSATHYRVQLKEQDLGESQKRYSGARIEVQVASVLMHAWSEVEHDLVYKPLEGNLSAGELAALDQLNGLVLAGEIALQTLQTAGQARVAAKGAKMKDHYDLAVHLLSHAEEMTGKRVNDSGLGRVDILFDFISELKLNTAEKIAPYLEALHGNVEQRPLADQITDALLIEDPDRYEAYHSVRERWTPDDRKVESQLGAFLARWTKLEALLRAVLPRERNRPLVINMAFLRRLDRLENSTMLELDMLRRMRNNIVHGVEPISPEALAGAVKRLDVIYDEVFYKYAP